MFCYQCFKTLNLSSQTLLYNNNNDSKDKNRMGTNTMRGKKHKDVSGIFGYLLVSVVSLVLTLIKGGGNQGPFNLQRVRKFGRDLSYRRIIKQGVGPGGQRESRERAERGSRSCLDWLIRTRNWPLPYRDSQDRDQIENPGLFFWNG